MNTFSVYGVLNHSGREIAVIENVTKREAWSEFKSHIGAAGSSFVIKNASGKPVYGWDQWAGEWAA